MSVERASERCAGAELPRASDLGARGNMLARSQWENMRNWLTGAGVQGEDKDCMQMFGKSGLCLWWACYLQ